MTEVESRLKPPKVTLTRGQKLAIRTAVFERDRRCKLQGVDMAGACYGPLTPHHKRKASQGGEYSLENLVALCAHHNDFIEADAGLAAIARSMGLVLRAGDE